MPCLSRAGVNIALNSPSINPIRKWVDFSLNLWHPPRMILYHGTSTEHLDAILKNGILPRCVTGRPNNYNADIPSHPDFVYVSDTYPAYYAHGAVKADDTEIVIIAVDVNQEDLYPDEDFVASCLSGSEDSDWKEVRTKIWPPLYQDFWEDSLTYNGVACTESISPKQIMDHRVIPTKGNIDLLLDIGFDSQPTMINHSLFGTVYRESVQALFASNSLDDAKEQIQKLHATHRKTEMFA